MSDMWEVTEEQKETIKNKKQKDFQLPFWVQSIVFLVGGTLFQADNAIRNARMLERVSDESYTLPYMDHLVIAFFAFALPLWLLQSFVLWLIYRKRMNGLNIRDGWGMVTFINGCGLLLLWFWF